MNILKRIVGVLCMLLAPVAAYVLTNEGLKKIAAAEPAERTNAITQWSILIIIFLPVMAGLFVFGRYAFNREFEDVAV